jgi:hypothetical protein
MVSSNRFQPGASSGRSYPSRWLRQLVDQLFFKLLKALQFQKPAGIAFKDLFSIFIRNS